MQAKDIIFSNEKDNKCLKIFINVAGLEHSISYSDSYIFSENYTIDNAKNLIPNINNISKKQKYSVINYVVCSLNQYKAEVYKTAPIKEEPIVENVPKKPLIKPIPKPTPKLISSEVKKPKQRIRKKAKIEAKPILTNKIIVEKDPNSWI